MHLAFGVDADRLQAVLEGHEVTINEVLALPLIKQFNKQQVTLDGSRTTRTARCVHEDRAT